MSLSVHEHGLNLTELSRYALQMVADMKSRMSLFIARIFHLSVKEGRTKVLIWTWIYKGE